MTPSQLCRRTERIDAPSGEAATLSRWRHGRVAAWAMLALCGGVCVDTRALEPFEDFQVHGFLTQGYFLTSSNRIYGHSEGDGSLDFIEAAINASWTPLPSLQLSAQPLFRRAGAGHESDFELDFGLLDYAVVSTEVGRLGFRLGRIKSPIGLYNDTRDVAFTRPSILLPEGIYFDRTRELGLSGDGAGIYGEANTRWGDWSLEFNGGLPRGDNLDTELTILGRDFPGSFENDLSYAGRLTYQLDGGRYKFAVSGFQLNLSFDPTPTPVPQLRLRGGTDQFEQLLFSAQYSGELWTFTGEYALRHTEDEGFGPAFPDTTFDGEAYYAQAMYRINPKWEAFVRYDALFLNRDDRDGTEFEAATGIPAHNLFAKDWTIGTRYYVTPEFMVAAEYHHVDGTGWLPAQDNPDPMATDKDWELFALLISYRF